MKNCRPKFESRALLLPFFSLVVAVVYFMLVVVYPSSVLAITQGDYDQLYAPHHTIGLDCAPGNSTSNNSDKVYIIGDSITVGAVGKYKEKLPGVAISAVAGRSWTGAGNTAAGFEGTTGTGKQAVEADQQKIKEAGKIVIALGTNGFIQQNPIDEIIAQMKQYNPNAPIYWVNIANAILRPGELNLLNDFNGKLDSQEAAGKIKVIKWNKLVDPKGDGSHDPNQVLRDGIHPTPNGVEKLVDLVVSATATGSVTTPTSTGATQASQVPGGAVSNIESKYSDSISVTYYIPSSSPAPLVLFAPGRFQDSKANGFYHRYLKAIAAQGFVVGGINFNPNNSYEINGQHGSDIKSIIDRALADTTVKDKINASSGVGIVGHSDGGFVSLMAGYAQGKKDDRIKAVVSEDSAIYGGTTNVAGPPLLLIHGTNDTIENISSSVSAYGSLNTPYTAFAKFKNADHYHYITDDSSTYLPAVDGITGAFLKRMLSNDGSDATKLSEIAKKHLDQIDFQEKGTDTPGGSGSSVSNSGSCTCGPESSVGIPTMLPDTVPEPHRSLFTQAASKFNVNPAYLTALFLSEQGNVWKPFDSQWASSTQGASGPFQFVPGTWQGHATDGDGDGKADIMNIRDAAYSAAHLIAAGTTKDTPMGDITKPFKDPNTILYNAAAYNWGGGNIQSHTNPDSPLSVAPKETQDYLNNVYTLITSGFTKSGKKEYGDPRTPGQSGGSSNTTPPTTSTSESCAGGGGGSGTFTAITGSHDELVSKVLSETNIQWGNGLAGASADDEKQDIKDCMTDTAIAGLIALAEQSGVKIIINTMARGHGGCTHAPGSDHNSGRAIDIGYYGNRAQGQGQHNADGDKLYKFIYDNREGLKIGQAIWQYPQDGLQCIGGGQPVDCDTYYHDNPGKPVISIHYHHIHIGFKQ